MSTPSPAPCVYLPLPAREWTRRTGLCAVDPLARKWATLAFPASAQPAHERLRYARAVTLRPKLRPTLLPRQQPSDPPALCLYPLSVAGCPADRRPGGARVLPAPCSACAAPPALNTDGFRARSSQPAGGKLARPLVSALHPSPPLR